MVQNTRNKIVSYQHKIQRQIDLYDDHATE
jgi:hypothetical protein